MFKPTLLIAALLVAVGLAGFFLGHPDPDTGHVSFTALIPEWIGLALGFLAMVAYTYPATRMHVMHLAALIGLLAVLGCAVQLVKTLGDPATPPEIGRLKVLSMSATLVLCALFLVLCVRSFIAARRARTAA